MVPPRIEARTETFPTKRKGQLARDVNGAGDGKRLGLWVAEFFCAVADLGVIKPGIESGRESEQEHGE